MMEFLRLHLIPKQALDMPSASIDDCVEHATKVAEEIAESLSHQPSGLVRLTSKPSDGGMRFIIAGQGVKVAYACFLGEYFNNKLLSGRMRWGNVDSPPAMKSCLLISDPQAEKASTILSATSTFQHDYLLNYEQGYPKGWQAFIRLHSPKKKTEGNKWRQHISTVRKGNAALDIIGLQPSEWVAKTDEGYVLRTKVPKYLS